MSPQTSASTRIPSALGGAFTPHPAHKTPGLRFGACLRPRPRATSRPGGGAAPRPGRPPQRCAAAEAGEPAPPPRGGQPPSRSAPELAPGTVLGEGGRYTVLGVLGRGGSAVTYRARDGASGSEVAIKALSLRGLRDWKALDLFEREAGVLAGLSHPSIPRYLAYFEEDSELDRAFFLVQELAQGRSLQALVGGGWRAEEAEVRRIGAEVLRVLQYLASLRPPVVHRDVKPGNIVLEGGAAGGRVFLVDFGGVAGVASRGDGLGSTVVGTYGFMAPEQFRGQASPASDLYGLGGTLLFLLSGRPPSAFPESRMRVDFSGVAMGPALAEVVEGLLEPVAADRMGAAEALALLTGERVAAPGRRGGSVGGSAFSARQGAFVDASGSREGRGVERRLAMDAPRRPVGAPRPYNTEVEVLRWEEDEEGEVLEIDIPPARLSTLSLTNSAFALVWNAFVAFWTVSALAGGGVLFAAFSIPFWGAGAALLKNALGRHFVRERLEIRGGRWRLLQALALAGAGGAPAWPSADGAGRKEVGGEVRNLGGAVIRTVAIVNGEPQTRLELQEGTAAYAFGEGLHPSEQEWLVGEINRHLDSTRRQQLEEPAQRRQALPRARQGRDALGRGSTGLSEGTQTDAPSWDWGARAREEAAQAGAAAARAAGAAQRQAAAAADAAQERAAAEVRAAQAASARAGWAGVQSRGAGAEPSLLDGDESGSSGDGDA